MSPTLPQRPARLGLWLTLAIVGCGEPPPAQWHQADGYRWRELRVPRRGRVGFRLLAPERTGIAFANTTTEEEILANEHVLNGSGVAVGDVDGDGLVDVYFSRLHGANALYRNLGDWRFVEVTERAGVGIPDQLSTGAVFADVDGDRDLDLLVTSIGGRHVLMVNRGDGTFDDRTDASGLERGFYGTTMTVADTDGDGDLDLYTAHNKVKSVRDLYPPSALEFNRVVQRANGELAIRPEFRDHYRLIRQPDRVMRLEVAEPDRFYLNDGTGRFQVVPFTSGAFVDEDGAPLSEEPTDWGLAARFFDADLDGDPDLYVCNDFESPDRFWINDGTGRFRLIDRVALRGTSFANMAMDFADIDRDGDIDMFQLDMLAMGLRQQKTQMPAEAPEPPVVGVIENRPQLPRNMLFLNRGDNTYAEAAFYAGLEASGWSWSVMFLDVDLDGYEDALTVTGHAHDFLDSDTKVRAGRLLQTPQWRRIRFLYPKLDLQNEVFRNRGDWTFERATEEWGYSPEADITHSLAAADLDGDGDLDLVMNRLDRPALVMRNENARRRVAVRLVGASGNTQGIGATVHVSGGPVPQQREVTLGGTYLSNSEPLHAFATGDADSVLIAVRWRSGTWSVVPHARPNRLYEIDEAGAGAEAPRMWQGPAAPAAEPFFDDVTARLGHVHIDAEHNDFARQPLLPRRLSHLGPGITWQDIDRDGDEDLVIPSGRGGRLAVYRNDGGWFEQTEHDVLPAALDQSAVVALPTARGAALLVGQMSYEATGDAGPAPSVFRVDLDAAALGAAGGGTRVSVAVPPGPASAGPLALADIDGDGDLDLFVGGRVVPGRYPAAASSALFRNQAGSFTLDRTNMEVLTGVGLVSAAAFSDVDGDGDPDLLLALEWGALALLRNEGGRFRDATDAAGLAEHRSWWNGITTGDLNGDGLPDLVATSWGRNTGFRVSPERPLLVYYGDFDGNGQADVITAQRDRDTGSLVPLRGRLALVEGVPNVGRRFPSYAEYARASLEDLLGPAWSQASNLDATTLDHMVFLNRGGRFEGVALPPEAQLAPAFGVTVADYDGDGHEDVFLAQNFFATDPRTPRHAAGRGLWLRGNGTGSLEPVSGMVSGVKVYGDQRGAAVADFDGDGRTDLAVGQNANLTRLYRNTGARPGLRIRLVGPPANPDAVGAGVRLVYRNHEGPLREIHAGAGYWSQDGPVAVMGMPERPTAVRVRWPGGEESTTPVPPGAREVTIHASAAPPR